MGWRLYNKKIDECLYDLPTGDQCKSVAKKVRTEEHGQNQQIEFEIRTPQGHPWMYSLPNTGWRMKWKYYK